MSTRPRRWLPSRNLGGRSRPAPRPTAATAAPALALLCFLLPQPTTAQGSSLATSGDIESGGKLVSTTAAGPPLQVSSAERVVNLNADLLDGLDAASFVLDADLAALASLVGTQQDTIEAQQELIARLHPKLILHNSRFRAWVTFVDDGGALRPAEATPVGAGSYQGFFHFTRDFYVDVFLRILDAREVFSNWWVFAAPLTDLAFTLTVLDTETGAEQTYSSPANARQSFLDTSAFPDAGGFPAKAPRGPEPSAPRLASATGASCVADAETLCLAGDRFQVRATFGAGPPADAQASVLIDTSHSGTFSFFDPSNPDLFLKIVETPAFFGVNIGTLSNSAFTVTVTDTCTGSVGEYTNPAGSVTNFGDSSSFPNIEC